MKTTSNLNLKKPEQTDVVDIDNFNDNADAIDGKFGAASGHTHDGTAGNGPKLGSSGIADGAVGTVALGAKSVTQAKIGDKAVAAAQLADGAATDTVIGSRTISDTTAPSANAGTPTTLFGWLANMIKQITGKTSWRTAPATTLEAAKTHMDATSAHGASVNSDANTIAMRDDSCTLWADEFRSGDLRLYGYHLEQTDGGNLSITTGSAGLFLRGDSGKIQTRGGSMLDDEYGNASIANSLSVNGNIYSEVGVQTNGPISGVNFTANGTNVIPFNTASQVMCPNLNVEFLGGYRAKGTFQDAAYIPVVSSNGGTLEIGQHIDFHKSGSTADFDSRLTAGVDGQWTLSSTRGNLGLRLNSGRTQYSTDGTNWNTLQNVGDTFGDVALTGAIFQKTLNGGAFRWATTTDSSALVLQDMAAGTGAWVKDILSINKASGQLKAGYNMQVVGKFWVNPQVAYGADFGGLDIAIGDNDTGFKWTGDGVIETYTNASLAATITGGGITVAANTSYGSRFLRNIMMSTSNPSGGQNGDIWLVFA
ncbi:hypothetical protein [Gorillibacterium sp. sgz500922]|uniref:hypothetical protein n=1 Tax=Gorillibacterium sp. sgz500922 TaxID=3446694 RepID=UPI003F67B2EF